jgi:hypothetical protein
MLKSIMGRKEWGKAGGIVMSCPDAGRELQST